MAASSFSDLELLMDHNLSSAFPSAPFASSPNLPRGLPLAPQQEQAPGAAQEAEEVAAAGGGRVPPHHRHASSSPSFASLSLCLSPLLAFSSPSPSSSHLAAAKLRRGQTPPAAPSSASLPITTAKNSSQALGPAMSTAAGTTPLVLARGAGSNTSLAAIAAPAIVSSKGKRSSCLSSSSFPDFLRLPEKARGFGSPSNGAASRRASIVWFRNDLRCHDNESLAAASEESLSILPVYVFDPRHYEKRFDRMMGGANRASFLIQCVSDLRESLKAIGSNLIVRVGNTEEVLVSLAKAIGADGLYAHQEVSGSDVEEEKKVACALESEGVDVKCFWGNTLFHVDDLPFKVKDTPNTYTAFCESVGKVSIRKAIEAPEQLKGLPIRGNVEPGEIPSLVELGVKSSSSSSQKKVSHAVTPLIGGEKEALQRLSKLAADHARESSKKSDIRSASSIYGANFSSKISPWLAAGCLSPRRMVEELKVKTNSKPSAHVNGHDANWLVFELQWRDFFRFITKKYAAAGKEDGSEALACASAC